MLRLSLVAKFAHPSLIAHAVKSTSCLTPRVFSSISNPPITLATASQQEWVNFPIGHYVQSTAEEPPVDPPGPTDEGGSGSDGSGGSSVPSGGPTGEGGGEDNSVGEESAEETSLSLAALENAMAFTSSLKPSEVVSALDLYIVGQDPAKRAVAIALRNRWRRKQLPEDFKNEVIPKNILMIGPTGCGKTEIARRLAKLSQAPFLKVEATKFTEVGFHGRDVDQIIRDLLDVSIALTKKKKTEQMREEASMVVEAKLLDLLCGPGAAAKSDSRDAFLKLLREGGLENQRVEVEVPAEGAPSNVIAIDQSNPNASVNEFLGNFQKMVGGQKGRGEKKKMAIKDARVLIEGMELEKLIDMAEIKKEAISVVEDSGIVFIDEIDKICSSGDYRGADASAEGVQRDLLPLIEGSVVSTKHGNVNTEFILFIASGAFHSVKPSDMLAELQGRLPIRVELKGLTEGDMYKILTEPITNMIQQQEELLKTEGVVIIFEDEAVREIARLSALINTTVENIGARRLHTVIERIVEKLSFDAPDMPEGEVVKIGKKEVSDRVSDMLVESDLSRYIL